MSYSPYDTILVAHDAMKSLANILKIGEKHASDTNLCAASLYPDMKPLTFRVHAATQVAVKLAARLAGTPVHNFDGDLVTFADMYKQVEKAQEELSKAD